MSENKISIQKRRPRPIQSKQNSEHWLYGPWCYLWLRS